MESKTADTDVMADDSFGVNVKTQGPPPCRLEWKKKSSPSRSVTKVHEIKTPLRI